jgi:hypothetical protein
MQYSISDVCVCVCVCVCIAHADTSWYTNMKRKTGEGGGRRGRKIAFINRQDVATATNAQPKHALTEMPQEAVAHPRYLSRLQHLPLQ